MASDELRRPVEHEISTKILKTLIGGFIRLLCTKKGDIVPDDLYILFQRFYPKALYLIIFNKKELNLTFCDTSKNDVKITFSNLTVLDDDGKHDNTNYDINDNEIDSYTPYQY